MATSPPAVRDAEPAPSGPADPAPPARRRTWPAVVLSTAAVAGLFTLLFLRNHRFAYLDDRQADGVAKLVDMGRILRSGEWPWLSTDVVNSGGYAVEYQNGVFNPVNLAFGVLMGGIDDAALASFLQLLAHLLLLTAAAAWLARLVGLSTAWAVAFAVSVGFGPYTVYWGAAWYQAIVSFSWFVLAVAAAVALHLTGRQRHGWLLLAATYLCHQSGWPLAIPVLGLFVGGLVVARLVTGHPRGATAWIAAWYGGGVLTSLVGLYPLVVSFEFASRSSSISNNSNFNVAPLEGLLHAADPSYWGWFTNFDGYLLQDLPHFYVAWFLLPVLVFWRPPASGSLPPHVRALGIATLGLLLVTALGALGPERVLVFRFPTRFLQYSGFFLLLAAALLVAHGTLHVLAPAAGGARWAPRPAGGQRAAGRSGRSGPHRRGERGGRRAVPGAGRPACRRPVCRRRVASSRTSDAVVALGTVVVMAVVALPAPDGPRRRLGLPARPDDGGAADRAGLHALVRQLRAARATRGSCRRPPPAPPTSTPSTTRPRRACSSVSGQVNGYSPLAHRFLREHLPIDDHGNFGDTGAELFTAEDPETGLTWLELLRVDQVITQLGPRDASLQELLDDSWQRVDEGRAHRDLPAGAVRPAGAGVLRRAGSGGRGPGGLPAPALTGVRRRHRLRRRPRPGRVRPAVVPGLLRHARRAAGRRRPARRHAGRRGPAGRAEAASWSSPTGRRGSFRSRPSPSPWSSAWPSPRWCAAPPPAADAMAASDGGPPGHSTGIAGAGRMAIGLTAHGFPASVRDQCAVAGALRRIGDRSTHGAAHDESHERRAAQPPGPRRPGSWSRSGPSSPARRPRPPTSCMPSRSRASWSASATGSSSTGTPSSPPTPISAASRPPTGSAGPRRARWRSVPS